MKFKTIINIKKLISILLCTVSISSVIPTTVLGGTGSNGLVEAPKLSKSVNDDITYDGTSAETKLPFKLNGNTVAKIVNTTNNHTLAKNKDYIIKNDEIFLTYKYLNKLDAGTYELKAYFYPAGKEYMDPDIKTVSLHIKKQNQQAKFNNLKSEYIYGENPGKISLNGVSDNKNIHYYSTTDVAKIDKETGELTIKNVGKFQIIAKKNSDDIYNNLYVKSEEIEVKPRKLNIINTKIKDKPQDGTIKAAYEATPTLEGIVDNDDVTLVPGKPYFKETCVKEKIEIGFLKPFYLKGKDKGKYDIDQPKNIYAKIYKAVSPKITKLTLTDENGNKYTPNNSPEKGWSNKDITLSYTLKKESFEIQPEDTEISINNKPFQNIDNFRNILRIDEKTKSKLKFTILKEDTYQVKIKIYDKKGNCCESSPTLVKIKKSIPNPVEIKSSKYSNNTNPKISGSGEPGCKVVIEDDKGNTLAKTTVKSNGKWEISDKEFKEGKHNIKVYQIDAAGNKSYPVYKELIVDLHGPTGSIKINNKVSNPTTDIITSKLPIHVEILAEDKLSGINKIEYLQTNKKDISNDNNWKPYYSPFKLKLPPNKPNDFFYLLAKLTDNASNQSLLDSNGIVLFTNSESK